MAVESAGIVLVRSDPRDVVAAIHLSRATYRKEVQNLVWATGYNLVAIPVAMGIFVPWGIDISMAAGAIAMSLSTIIVAANAQLLRRVRLRPETPPPPARVETGPDRGKKGDEKAKKQKPEKQPKSEKRPKPERQPKPAKQPKAEKKQKDEKGDKGQKCEKNEKGQKKGKEKK